MSSKIKVGVTESILRTKMLLHAGEERRGGQLEHYVRTVEGASLHKKGEVRKRERRGLVAAVMNRKEQRASAAIRPLIDKVRCGVAEGPSPGTLSVCWPVTPVQGYHMQLSFNMKFLTHT